MELLSFQRQLTGRLLTWSWASIVAGVLLMLPPRAAWRAFGLQQAVWGLIDGLIATAGERAARRNPPRNANEEHGGAQRLYRLLLLNTALDVGYVAFGLWLRAGDDRRRRGHGWGIVFQGGFLLLFDAYQAARLRRTGLLDAPP